ncbi:hypothetical protein BLA29_012941 [Euroglyphus maynei]|uniref:Uncharacterized protein n=1 Tax=Euroglyphus maynei TaxID=6958 RepID=A0A1Y3BT18_EURMA|nr:hypothetical protein BLA29_012941 [Euroglyphus maynei]
MCMFTNILRKNSLKMSNASKKDATNMHMSYLVAMMMYIHTHLLTLKGPL